MKAFMKVTDLPAGGADMIDAACWSVRHYIEQEVTFGSGKVEFFDGRGSSSRSGYRLRLHERPVRAITEITIDDVVLDPASYTFREESGIVRIKVGFFTSGTDNIRATYNAGWDIPSAPIREVEHVYLIGFSGTDSFKLTWDGIESAAIIRSGGGANYTTAGIKAVLEATPGFIGTVTVSGITDAGFAVTWDTPGAQPLAPLTVTSPSGCTGTVIQDIIGADAGIKPVPANLVFWTKVICRRQINMMGPHNSGNIVSETIGSYSYSRDSTLLDGKHDLTPAECAGLDNFAIRPKSA